MNQVNGRLYVKAYDGRVFDAFASEEIERVAKDLGAVVTRRGSWKMVVEREYSDESCEVYEVSYGVEGSLEQLARFVLELVRIATSAVERRVGPTYDLVVEVTVRPNRVEINLRHNSTVIAECIFTLSKEYDELIMQEARKKVPEGRLVTVEVPIKYRKFQQVLFDALQRFLRNYVEKRCPLNRLFEIRSKSKGLYLAGGDLFICASPIPSLDGAKKEVSSSFPHLFVLPNGDLVVAKSLHEIEELIDSVAYIEGNAISIAECYTRESSNHYYSFYHPESGGVDVKVPIDEIQVKIKVGAIKYFDKFTEFLRKTTGDLTELTPMLVVLNLVFVVTEIYNHLHLSLYDKEKLLKRDIDHSEVMDLWIAPEEIYRGVALQKLSDFLDKTARRYIVAEVKDREAASIPRTLA